MAQVSISQMTADPSAILREIRIKGFRHVYIHIYMDVLDPSDYPHVKHPTPHGLMIKTLGKILALLASSFHIAGLGIVEFTPEDITVSSKSISMETAPLTETKSNPGLARITSLMDIFR